MIGQLMAMMRRLWRWWRNRPRSNPLIVRDAELVIDEDDWR